MRFPTFKRVGKSILIFLAIVVCLFIYSLSDHLVNGGLLLHQPVELQECPLISPHLSINELFYKFSTNFIHKNVYEILNLTQLSNSSYFTLLSCSLNKIRVFSFNLVFKFARAWFLCIYIHLYINTY